MHSITFTTNSGRAFGLQGPSWLVSSDVRGWELSVDSGTGTVEQGVRSLSGDVCFLDETEANDFLRLTAQEARDGLRGTLAVDGWQLSCMVTSGKAASWSRRHRIYSVTFYASDPVWRRTTAYHMLPYTGTQTDDSLDYPHDYPHDYGGAFGSYGSHAITSEGPCLLGITFFGPCANPYCRVASSSLTNTYGVDSSAAPGERIVIDPLGKKVVGGSIYLVSSYGERTNLFDKRRRGVEGSGSYIFQRMPGGEMHVSWPQSYGIDVAVIEERTALPWT